ncbi:MAG: anaerobic sulfatase maturase [Eubacteriales bacterium]|nr:anaerobic sulfatase maturase [Eubacteriales bacterium]
MPAIHVMIKPASGLCNMRCKYCFYADEMEKRSQASYGVMSLETLESVLQKVFSFAEESCTIAFQGGEPTLAGLDFFRACVRLAQQYNTKKIRVSYALQTNGYGLDEEWCRFFAENRFLLGLSVDGIRATHDSYRKDAAGQDTYLRVLEGARLLERFGVEFNVLTVVNARTAPKIRRIYESYRKLGFAWQQYIACLDPIDEIQGKQEYSLTPEAYGRFLIELFELWDLDLRRGQQPYIRQFENYVGILMGRFPESCEQRGVCSFQNIVEADGSVYPCDFYVMDQYRLGNLKEDDFETINERRLKIGFVEASMNHTESCRACPYFMICRGGCRRHREQPGSAPGENYFCKSYRMFFDACLPRLREIAENCLRTGGFSDIL